MSGDPRRSGFGQDHTRTVDGTQSGAGRAELNARSKIDVKVTARIDTRTAEAAVKVYPGDKLPIGTAIWEVAPIPCSKTKTRGITKAVQAVPQ